MHKLLLFFLIITSTVLVGQNSAVTRQFDQTQLEEFTADEKYQYDRQPEIREPNAFLKGLGKVLEYIGDFITSKAGVLFLVIVLVFGILFAYRNSIFKKKSKKETVEEYIPNIVAKEGLDLQKIREAIEQAEKKGDYRSAIRNLYLQVILSLAHAKLIKLHIEKTNTDYRKELPKKYQADFRKLTRIFDFVWYGDYPASETLFAQAKTYASTLNREKNVA